jgi:hypothetical protein
LHQIDEIIVIKEGRIIENGTFKQLMANKGHLANLVGEHVQIVDPTPEPHLDKNNEHKMPIHIENNQLALMGSVYSRRDSISLMERNRMSVVTLDSEAPVPSDAEPMKLVLEDQSVNYKQIPFITYLKSGTGVIITLAVFVLFFLVHCVRIFSGNFFLINFYYEYK